MKLLYCLLAILCPVSYSHAQSLSNTLTGRIITSDGNPVTATVSELPTGNSVTTNADGYFSIKALPTAVSLSITGINIESLIVPVKGRLHFGDIAVVSKVINAGEVIVASTGYQSLAPNQSNGALAIVSNKAFNQQAGTSVLNRLDGMVAGLSFVRNRENITNPQNNTGITIRGLSTINGPLDPLVVLDGFIYEGDLSNLNPNDVENITVLKDAAAASIWGARAGNGVIIITSKKGKYNQRTQLNFSSGVILNAKPDLFALSQMSTNDYIDVEQFLFNKGFFNSRINTRYNALTPAVEVFLQRRLGNITAADSATKIDALKSIDSRNEYNEHVYTTPVVQQHALTMRGGSASNNWLLGLGYDNTIGALHNSFSKINVRLANQFRPVNQLEISLGASYTDSRNLSGMLPYNSSTLRPGGRQANYYRLVNDDGTPATVATTYRPAFTDTLGGGLLLNYKYYPLEEYRQATSHINLRDINANVGLTYKFSNALSFDLRYQYQIQTVQNERLATAQSYEARSLVNLFSQLNRTNGTVNYIVPPGGIRTLGNSEISSQTARAQINYSRTWGKHTLVAIAGAESRQIRTTGGSYSAYGYNEDPLTSSPVDVVKSYPTIITGGSQFIGAPPQFFATLDRFVSLYTNTAYTYKQRYTASFSIRRDGSNIFGANTNDRWKPLASYGLGWNIHDEPFYKFSWLSTLRLRTSYGTSGNVDLSKSAQPVAEYAAGAAPTYFPFAGISRINNPDLRWERSHQFNVGITFSMLHDRLSGSIDFYRKKGTDLYGETLYDYTVFGQTATIVKNVAATKGKGMDLSLSAIIMDKPLRWETTILLAYNTDKVTAYNTTAGIKGNNMLGAGKRITPVVGKPLYGISAYRWGGLDTLGNPRGYVNGALSIAYGAISSEASRGGINSGNVVYIGPGAPEYFGSWIHTISYRQVSLSVNIAYKFRYYFARPLLSYAALINNGVGHPDYEKRWQKRGDELSTTVPSFTYPANVARDNFYAKAEINFLKGDHIRLQYINLDYTLTGFRKIPVKSLQLYANVANLGILWRSNAEKLDPDYPGVLPASTAFAFGLRAGF